jgi:hypothetical protein
VIKPVLNTFDQARRCLDFTLFFQAAYVQCENDHFVLNQARFIGYGSDLVVRIKLRVLLRDSAVLIAVSFRFTETDYKET